ncbi:Putative restriction endonuclease, type I, HsdS [Magnetospirillum sp. XM-1]|uniref:restriction endonuclease subunit S n=1 Tax=Magnetospirillum sp. XM-1 TaxID=1663591 RepID=UPI00073E08B7|nr:restriction endonuclease subunit S [Magnetospirillum sp. XM-1]CUW41791.1 Putative restriction endonuclease, type I, HsdS [Magnetospirillum sp. XM-1]
MSQKVPEGWKKVALGDVLELQKGYTYTSEGYSSDPDSLPFAGIKVFHKGGGFNLSGLKKYTRINDERFIAKSGDIFIANTDLTRNGDIIGSAITIPDDVGECIFSMDISKVVVRSHELVREYAYYLINSPIIRREMRSLSGGSTVIHLKTKSVPKIVAFLPPLPEQHRIAEILSSVDEAIAATQAVIDQTRTVKQGVMNRLLTKGIGHTRFKQTEIGEIPEEWDIKSLEHISIVERGRFSPRPRNDPRYYGGQIPFVQTGDVVSADTILSTHSQTLNEQGLAVSKMFPCGSILITIAANIGDTAITSYDVCCPDSVVGIIPNGNIDVWWLEAFLASKKSYLDSVATKNAQKNINLQHLRPLKIPVPPQPDQKHIGLIANYFYDALRVHSAQLASLKRTKSALMSDLLTGRKRVSSPGESW